MQLGLYCAATASQPGHECLLYLLVGAVVDRALGIAIRDRIMHRDPRRECRDIALGETASEELHAGTLRRRLKALPVRPGMMICERSQFIAIDQASTSSSCLP